MAEDVKTAAENKQDKHAAAVAALPSAGSEAATASGTNKPKGLGGSREERNWLIHQLYVRHEHRECLQLIEEVLHEYRGHCEYPLFVKGLIRRQQGNINESLQLFQAATAINPHNVANLKQVGRSLYLLGKHKQAIEVYDEALQISVNDWEILHNKGLCYMYVKNYDKAIECFRQANEIQRHDSTYMQLGRVYTIQENYQAAADVYTEALEYSPDNTELLTSAGLLYLRLDETAKAFSLLGNAMTLDGRDPKAILAAGSIIQDRGDLNVALVKYRVAASATPQSPHMWNNIGMCFFGMKKYAAAIACLKRALYFNPFEWIVAYNLGLVHLHTEQYASAFHYFSSCINMKPDHASAYTYLAIALARLEDFENACNAYQKGLDIERDAPTELNFAIMLFNHGQTERAKAMFRLFKEDWDATEEEAKAEDPEIAQRAEQLSQMMFGHALTAAAPTSSVS